MERVNYPIKLSALIKSAKEYMKKHGDKYVLISDDEEGNGFHECYYAFSEAIKDAGNVPSDLKPEDCVMLG